MTDKKGQTRAGAAKLSEEDLDEVQGGWSWGETNGVVPGKKVAWKVNGFDGKGNDQLRGFDGKGNDQ